MYYLIDLGHTFGRRGDLMGQKFYICKHCGNIVAIIRNVGVPIYCCGEKMHEIVPNSTEASGEKHVPVYEVNGNIVHVTVGAVEHPMTEEHYIEWICLETEQGIQYAHLNPNDEPRAKFALCDGDKIEAAYAFCNKHSLWRN